eukprot:7417492-Pyramimonas_sp.AAC.1
MPMGGWRFLPWASRGALDLPRHPAPASPAIRVEHIVAARKAFLSRADGAELSGDIRGGLLG